MSGILYGIGLGPGDPELMTLKAVRLIGAAGIVAYPALPGVESFARSIAAGALAEGCLELRLNVPMTPARGPAQEAYDLGAARIGEALAAGEDVAFLCEGDPLFYGSFMYVAARLAGRFAVEVVPGVTSVSAATARLARPLTARNEVLSVIPGPCDTEEMRARVKAADAVAIMKVGRHLGRIRGLLTGMGLADSAHYIERATLPSERRMALADAPDPAPYFSMILVTKGADPWL
jgi:precorrin-2/cobalt-factor-2 C20-methyltransferase